MKKFLYYSPYYPIIGFVLVLIFQPEDLIFKNNGKHSFLSILIQAISISSLIMYLL